MLWTRWHVARSGLVAASSLLLWICPIRAAAASSDYAELLAPKDEGKGLLDAIRDRRTYPYIERAHRLIAAGDLVAARKDLGIYLERAPDDAGARFTYGVLLSSLEDWSGAASAMTDVLRRRPGFGPAHLYRAIARQHDGDDPGALRDFEAAGRSGALDAKDRTFAWESAVDAAVGLGDDARALAALGELEPTPTRELRRVGLLADLGRDREALRVARGIDPVGLAPGLQRRRLEHLVQLESDLGDLSAARAAAEDGARLDPDDPAWLDRLAVIAVAQGDAPAAELYRRRALALAPTPERRRALSVAAERAGDTALALEAARGVVAGDGDAAGTRTRDDFVRLAVLAGEAREPLAAARAYERAFRAGGETEPALLVRAARAYGAAGAVLDARRVSREALDSNGASVVVRADALRTLANVDEQAGDEAAARDALERLVRLEGPTSETLRSLGDLQRRTGEPAAALATYARSLRLRDDATTRLSMGYALQEIGKPGLAAYELERSLDGRLSRTQKVSAYRSLGYALAEVGDAAGAADAWTRANELEPDPVVTLALARVERLAGRPLAASETLERLAPDDLRGDLRARYWSERSALAQDDGNVDDAIAAEERALQSGATPERRATLGGLLAKAGRGEDARRALRGAVREGDSSVATVAALGHVDLDLGDAAAAIDRFEQALRADPDMLSLREDLGYAYVREVRNDDAVRAFERAIDDAPFHPVTSDEEREALRRRMDRLRREVTELDRWISLVAYTSICFGASNCLIDQTALIEGASESQGGAELSVRPPVIGFRDGRIFEIISRVLYQQEVDSIEPIGRSLVATLGARYKPLQSQDFYLSVERIFGVGSDATDNTLVRASYGLLHGYRVEPGRSSWTYATLYLDLSYTTERPRNWFAYVEGRVGRSFNYADRALVTPLAYVRNRSLTGDAEDFFDVDVGLGVSLRWLWNGDRYHDDRSAFELLPRVGYDAYNSDGRGWNVFLTGVVRL